MCCVVGQSTVRLSLMMVELHSPKSGSIAESCAFALQIVLSESRTGLYWKQFPDAIWISF